MERERVIGFEFKVMNHIIGRTIQKRMTAAGFDEVTVMHGHILGYLCNNADHEIYAREIVKKFGIGKSSVTNILQLMEEKGYITYLSDERDGRLKKICPTPKGEEIHRQTIAVLERMNEDLERDITPEERETFFRVVDRVKENAKGIE